MRFTMKNSERGELFLMDDDSRLQEDDDYWFQIDGLTE
jgi:hypothetical protein